MSTRPWRGPARGGRDAARGNLAQPAEDIAGRENEVTQVKQLLESSQIVTLLGDRKSLAWLVGSQLGDQFTDGVWCVDLRSLSDPALVTETVASTLGVCRDVQRPLTVSLIEHLREKNLLLLLGHCEHLLGACVQLTETILRTCPDVRILTTSYKPLGIPAEKFYPAVA